MGEEATFSDDISALWGPGDTGIWEPGPARRTAQNGELRSDDDGSTAASAGERLTAVEGEVKVLAEAVEALRGDLDVLPAIQTGLSGSEERLDGLAMAMEEARDALGQRLTALERDVQQGLAKLAAAIEAHEFESVGKHRARNVREELREQLTAELDAVRVAMEDFVERRISEAESTVHRRLDDLSAQVAATNAAERLAATERRTALLAESIEAYRRETTRDPNLEAIRADLQAAADEIAARTDDRFTQQLHDLAAHLTHGTAADRRATDDRMNALEQRIIRLGELLGSHRARSVMGWELESLRTDVMEAVRAELAALTESQRAMANGIEAEEERRRLEASWQQSMPGF